MEQARLYLIFDICVGVLLGGVTVLLLRPLIDAPVSIVPNTNIQRRHHKEDEDEAPVHHAVEAYSIYAEVEPMQEHPVEKDDDQPEPQRLLAKGQPIPNGDYAEVYTQDATMTMTVRIADSFLFDDKWSYHVIDGLSGVRIKAPFESAIVHPYSIYPAGTEAKCTGLRTQGSLTACVVVDAHKWHDPEHPSRSFAQSFVYEVTYSDEEGKEVVTLLSPARVNRILTRQNPRPHEDGRRQNQA